MEIHSINNFVESMGRVINEIKSSGLLENGPHYQPSIGFYNKYSNKNLIKRIKFLKNLLSTSYKINNDSILEIGSGYGLNLIILRFLGFKKVFGIEIIESMNNNANLLIDTAKKYLNLNLDDCKSIFGNAEATKFKDEEFPNIIAIEVISHVPSFDRLMREMNRILVNNGFFIISDGNNLSCPYYKRKRLKIWEKVRNEELEKRVLFLKKRFPFLDPQLRASIAIHTELLQLNKVEKIVPNIISSNKLPMSLYFKGYAPVFAESGIWDEWGFYPKELVNQLSLYGFLSKIKIYFASARGFPFTFLENMINFLPLSVKVLLRPNFRCYAEKKETTKYLIVK